MNTSSGSDEPAKGGSAKDASAREGTGMEGPQIGSSSEERSLDTQWCREALKVYREVHEAHRGPPSSNKRCNLINVNWMKIFVKFGAYLEKRSQELSHTQVS